MVLFPLHCTHHGPTSLQILHHFIFTGQTTGIWLVSFCSPSAVSCQQADKAWEGLRQELRQQQIFLARVSVAV